MVERRDLERSRLIAEKKKELEEELNAKLEFFSVSSNGSIFREEEERKIRLAELEKLRRQEEREQKRRQKVVHLFNAYFKY